MAVLYLLLENHPGARSIPDLAGVLIKHPWTAGKRFLLVPYHLIGARNLQSAILGGYVEHVRRHHECAGLAMPRSVAEPDGRGKPLGWLERLGPSAPVLGSISRSRLTARLPPHAGTAHGSPA